MLLKHIVGKDVLRKVGANTRVLDKNEEYIVISAVLDDTHE